MGDETVRELERLETAIVHEIRRRKYACRCCTDGVVTTPGPDRVIEKGILGPGFLASVAVERFGNHMPYHRLEKKYAGEGLNLSRSVLERSLARSSAGWVSRTEKEKDWPSVLEVYVKAQLRYTLRPEGIALPAIREIPLPPSLKCWEGSECFSAVGMGVP
jgi:transposase